MRVVIFGANGQLGRALQQVFAFEEVYAYGKDEMDITTSVYAKPMLKDLKPHFLINCAAWTDVESAEVSPFECKKINSAPLEWIAPYCEKHSITLVQLSSNFIFGNKNVSIFNEDVIPLSPLNEYGKSKLLAETTIKRHCPNHLIVRTSWLFGSHNKFIATLLGYAKKGGRVELPNDEWSSPTYVLDLSRAIYSLCQDFLDKKTRCGTYHLVNSGMASKALFASKILEFANCTNVEVVPVLAKDIVSAKRPKNGVIINTRRPELRLWQQALQEFMLGMGYSS